MFTETPWLHFRNRAQSLYLLHVIKNHAVCMYLCMYACIYIYVCVCVCVRRSLLHTSCSAFNIRVIKSRRIGWAGHVKRKKCMRNSYKILVEIPKNREDTSET
jgi:hypothetical protein